MLRSDECIIDEVASRGVDLYQKYKKTYDVALHLLILFLRAFVKDYEIEKGKRPAMDFIIQKGSEWIKKRPPYAPKFIEVIPHEQSSLYPEYLKTGKGRMMKIN